MAISYVGGQVNNRTNASSALSVNFALTGGSNSTPSAGDLVVVTVVCGSAATNPAQAIITPAGYTALGQLNQSAQTSDTAMNVSWKVMTSTPDTAVTIPTAGDNATGQAYTIQVFRGVNTTTPMDVTAIAAGGVGTSRPDPGSITPVTAGAWVLICGGGATGTGVNYVAPTNYTTNFLTSFSAETTDAIVGSGYWTGWTSGAENPAAYTGGTALATDSWSSYTLALRPLISNGTSTTSQAQSSQGNMLPVVNLSATTSQAQSASSNLQVLRNPLAYVGGQVAGRAGSLSTLVVNFALTGGISSLPIAGDLVVVTVVVGSSTTTTPTLVPTGYTSVPKLIADSTRDTSLQMSYKVMGGTPDTSVTIPQTGNVNDAQCYTIQVFRGCDRDHPIDLFQDNPANINQSTGLTARPSPSHCIPFSSGIWLLVVGGAAAAAPVAFTAPAGYATNFLTTTATSTNGAIIGSGYKTTGSVATVDEQPADFGGGTTNTADSFASYTFPLRPESPSDTSQAQSTSAVVTLSSGGTGDISATVAITETSDTVASTATVDIAASLSKAEAGDTVASTSLAAIVATASIGEVSDTVASTGTVADPSLNASVAVTELSDTVASTALAAIVSTLARTEAGDTVSGSTLVSVGATVGITEASDTVASTDVVAVAVTASLTEASDTASGTLTVSVGATVSITELGDAVGSSSTVGVAATLSSTEVSDTVGSTAVAAVAATLSRTEADDTASSSVTVNVTATVGITEASDTVFAYIGASSFATVAVTEASDTVASSATVAVAASTSYGEAADTVGSTSTVGVAVTATITEASDSVASSSTLAVVANVTITEVSDTVSSTVTTVNGVNGVVAITEAADTVSSAGTANIGVSVAITEVSDTAAGTVSVSVVANVTATEASDTLAATITGPTAISATASITEAADSVAVSVVVSVTASSSNVEASDTSTASVQVSIRAATAATEDSDTVASNIQAVIQTFILVVESEYAKRSTALVGERAYIKSVRRTKSATAT